MTNREFNYKECLMTFCNSCRSSYELLGELGFRMAYYDELTEILKFCEEGGGISCELSVLESVEHTQVKHIVAILRALTKTFDHLVNINRLDLTQLNTNYEEGTNAECWSYWEEKTIQSERELEDNTYIFIYSVLYNVNMFALILSTGVVEDIEDYDPFAAVDLTLFDQDDQNVRIILDLLEEIRKPFENFHWDEVMMKIKTA